MLRRLKQVLLMLICATSVLSGCIVRERVVVRDRVPPCPGGVWVEGHYGPYGHWHSGYWRCPS
jgi:hypothetical protein